MYKRSIIYYFSGTGNTAIVAEQFSSELGKAGVESKAVAIERPWEKKLDTAIDKYDLVGIGFPVYALDAPQIIYDFIMMLPDGNGRRAFIFKTAADSAKLDRQASSKLVRMLSAKHYDVFYDELLVMPFNTLYRYKPELEKQLYEVAIRKVGRFTAEILGDIEKIENERLGHMLFHWFGNLEKKGAPDFGTHLKTASSCNLCGICERGCPAGNIKIENGNISFGERCQVCLRCIYSCPRNAITPQKGKWIKLKQGYDLSKVINDSSIKGDYLDNKRFGLFTHLKKYARDC